MPNFQIHDLYLHPVKNGEGRRIVLQHSDHLLRRFGQVEVRQLAADSPTDFTLRAEADELWAVIDGEVDFALLDQRPHSPSFEAQDSIRLASAGSEALLIPFGVAYAMSCKSDAQLLRLTTHADGEQEADQILPRQELVGRFA